MTRCRRSVISRFVVGRTGREVTGQNSWSRCHARDVLGHGEMLPQATSYCTVSNHWGGSNPTRVTRHLLGDARITRGDGALMSGTSERSLSISMLMRMRWERLSAAQWTLQNGEMVSRMLSSLMVRIRCKQLIGGKSFLINLLKMAFCRV